MKLFFTILVAGACASLSFADDTVEVSGMKVKRLGSRGGAEEQISFEESHSKEQISDKRIQRRPNGEVGLGSGAQPSSHFLGESLVYPKRRPFTDW